MKQIILDETENKILNCLKVGKSNAVRRETIAQLTNIHDRKVRSCIASMRRKGVAIISSSSCAGYWLAENDDEKKEYLKMMESYGKHCFGVGTTMRQELKNAGQMSIEELL